MKRVFALGLGLSLVACSAGDVTESTFNAQAKADEQAKREGVADRAAVRAGFEPSQPAPLATVSVDPVKASAPGEILPPADRQYRYIGRWAVTPAACREGVWSFQTRRLTTAGDTACDLPTVAARPSGYELNGTCRTQGVKTAQTVKLTFDERQRTMHVDGRTVGPLDLIYCGD